jgi:hypothetical protein
MRSNRFLSVLAGLTALSVTGGAAAADSPQETYHLDLTCASVAAAANADTQGQPSPADRRKGADLAAQTLAIAQTSGGKLGLTPPRIDRAVAENRDRLLGGLRQPDHAKAEAARKDLGQTLIRCALLHAITH